MKKVVTKTTEIVTKEKHQKTTSLFNEYYCDGCGIKVGETLSQTESKYLDKIPDDEDYIFHGHFGMIKYRITLPNRVILKKNANYCSECTEKFMRSLEESLIALGFEKEDQEGE